MNEDERHEVFKWLLKKSFFYQGLVWCYLRGNDVPAILGKMQVWEKNPGRKFFDEDGGDIMVGDLIIEVKSIGLEFTCVDDYPYGDVVVDNIGQHDEKVRKGYCPNIYVFVSQVTGAMIWTSVKEWKHEWQKKVIPHRWTKEMRHVYTCWKSHCNPIRALVSDLKDILGDQAVAG